MNPENPIASAECLGRMQKVNHEPRKGFYKVVRLLMKALLAAIPPMTWTILALIGLIYFKLTGPGELKSPPFARNMALITFFVILPIIYSSGVVAAWRKGFPAWSYSWLATFISYVGPVAMNLVITVPVTYFAGVRPDKVPLPLHMFGWFVFFFLPAARLLIWLFLRRGRSAAACAIFSILMFHLTFYFFDKLIYPVGGFLTALLLALIWTAVSVAFIIWSHFTTSASLVLVLGTVGAIAIYRFGFYSYSLRKCAIWFPGLSPFVAIGIMATPVVVIGFANVVLWATKLSLRGNRK